MRRHARITARPAWPRWVWSLALILPAIAGGGLAPGCQREPEVEGYSKIPMARQTVMLFLEHLRAGDYAAAARYYAGPLEPLRDAYPDIAADDVAGLLERFATQTGGFCADYRMVAASMRTRICYPVKLEFCTGKEETPVECEFLVYFDGRVYQLLGLPPTVGEAGLHGDAAPS